MVICLTLSYFIYAISNILSNFETQVNGHSETMCQADAFLRTVGAISSFIWAHRIAKAAYLAMVDPKFRSRNESDIINLLKGFALPVLLAVM